MKYSILYVDPPWKSTNAGFSGSSANHYAVMGVHEMCQLKVPDLCEKDCVLFMWWMGSLPHAALSLCNAWGFSIKTMTCFCWSKLCKSDTSKRFFGMGFWARQSTENCLIATKGKIKPARLDVSCVVETYTEGIIEDTLFAPLGKHSAKPAVVRTRIVELMGDIPRVELFARERVAGWDCWGNEVTTNLNL